MAALWRAFNILGNPLVVLPDQLKKDLRELQDLYQRRITVDELDVIDDAEAEDDTERDNELGGSPSEDTSNTQALSGSTLNLAGKGGVYGATSKNAPNPGGGHIIHPDARASSAADSAIDVSPDTSQKFRKITQIASNARNQRKLDLVSQSASQLSKNRPLARLDVTQHDRWKWGPKSSSEDKAFRLPKMNGWAT